MIAQEDLPIDPIEWRNNISSSSSNSIIPSLRPKSSVQHVKGKSRSEDSILLE